MSCKIHCPEFPAELNYFPYYEGQELQFINSQRNIQSFTITNKENSESEVFGQNCKCLCYIFTYFNINSLSDSLSMRCEINIDGRENVWGINIDCHIEDNLRNKELLSIGVELPDNKISYDEIDKYLEDTIIIENKNNKTVTKIVFVKNKGLVSYTTADGEEWKLVE